MSIIFTKSHINYSVSIICKKGGTILSPKGETFPSKFFLNVFTSLRKYNRIIMKEYQLARRLKNTTNICYTPLPFHVTQIVNPFLNSMGSANHD